MWTSINQATSERDAVNFQQEFTDAMKSWENSLLAGNPGNSHAIVDDVVRRWRVFIDRLKGESDAIMSNEHVMESLGEQVYMNEDEKQTLDKLRKQAITRSDQSDSVNPKIRGSPYTNILGLRRVFRDSTRLNILIASIVFGLLAIGALGTLTYGIYISPSSSSSNHAHGGQRANNKTNR